ncbi:deacetylvindoline O-acetyltransferase-like [Hibiscus syriacus]|nr:deacetylvindoline O-acetyltransferase-like [Hibiscus syriacus]
MASTEIELWNQLLPCQCYCVVPTSTSPQTAIQVTVFGCGGIAIAFCGSHKLIDGTTGSAFIKTWASFNRGSNGELRNPDVLDAASRLFPPMESIPQDHLSLTETLWFREGWHTTKSFSFHDDAIATLKLKAKSKRLEHPTRNVALTAFIWKHAMLATRAASGRSRPTVLTQSVNLRPMLNLPEHAIGNLVWFVISSYNPSATATDIELDHLAYLVKDALDVSKAQISLLQSGDVLKAVTELS